MQQSIVETVKGVHVPWGTDQRKLVKTVSDYTDCDSFAAGILNVSGPQADELLAVHGWSAAVVSKWLSGAAKDKMIATAIKDGIAVAYPGQKNGESGLQRGGNCVVAVLPESISENRYWWFAAGRNGNKAFSTLDQQKVQLLLRRWQARFLMPDEQKLGRVIVGHDNRLIACDLDTRDLLLANPTFQDELVTTVQRVAEQRFPNLEDNDTRDIAVKLGKTPYWVVFRRRRVITGAQAIHWYIEIRPMEDDELMPVGTVKDDRIAKAIAFFHEKFDDAPSLAQVSKHVHMSPFHFHRLFSKQVGISPKHYLMRKQLQMAKWLLRAHRVPIGNVASATGFSSHGHFTSTFHRLIGVSPTEYRESFY